MRQNGNKLVQVWLDPAEAIAIKRQAEAWGMKLAAFVRRCAYAVADGSPDLKEMVRRRGY